MIKAVFFDMDGTLISHRLSDIPLSARQALRRLREKGVLLFMATGRYRQELDQLPMPETPFDGYVTLTGHICCDGQWNVISKHPLPIADSAALGEIFRRKEIPLMLVEENAFYINFVDDLVERLLKSVSTLAPDIGRYTGEPLYSAVAFGGEEAERILTEALPGCRISRWSEMGFDIVSRSESKVRGMQIIMERFGLEREEIAAFGDGDNDAEMLAFAGCGIAMGNASPLAKASADHVTSSVDEDGLLRGLTYLGLLP